MRQQILLHGIDKLVLQQQVAAIEWPPDLSHPDKLAKRIAAAGFQYRGWLKRRGETVLQFRDLDLRSWPRAMGRTFEVHASSEALTCRPRETWRAAQDLFAALGAIFGFQHQPEVVLLDLFIDVAGLHVCPSFIDRIHCRTGLKCERGADAVAFGTPRRLLIYNKLRDALERLSKRYVLELHREAGWNGRDPIARIDMRFDRKQLRRLETFDLDKLRDDILTRVVLMRRVHLRGKGRSVQREDGLWRRLKAVKFTPPWDSPPSTLRIPTMTLDERANHAAASARWALAALTVIATAHPELLDEWPTAVVQATRDARGVHDADFQDALRNHAGRLHLPEPLKTHGRLPGQRDAGLKTSGARTKGDERTVGCA